MSLFGTKELSTISRARRLVTGLLVGFLGLPMVQAVVAEPALASTTRSSAVTVATSRSSVLAGESVRLTGKVAVARAGEVVTVERRDPLAWHTVARSRLSRSRTFVFVAKPRTGRTSYRVVRPRAAGRPRLTSRTVQILARPRIAVQARVSAAAVITGQEVRIQGSVGPGKSGDVVKVQRLDPDTWRTLAFSRLTASRTYSFTVRPAAGTVRYRVVRPETEAGARGTSATLTVGSTPCPAMPRPTRTMLGWSNDPTLARTSSMATNLRGLFCAVAPNATVRVAMFLMSSDTESEVILSALETMHRHRGVRVEILLEDTPYTAPIGAGIRKRLGQFATLRTCQKGCRSLSSGANMHHKFVTVTDTSWAPGADPVLWTSSSNWTKRQLREYWQTGVLIYGDRRLTREFDARFESMSTCALAAGCGAWRPSVFGQPLPESYRLLQTGESWTDAGLGWRAGDEGTGTRVLFSPVAVTTPDPVASELARYACTPEHRTVRLGIFAMSAWRGPFLARALGQLARGGCDIQALVNIPAPELVEQKGVADLRAQGVGTSCVQLMHDKFVYLDVVDRETGSPRHVLWTGSQNFTGAGLYYNDDTMVTMEAELASGQRAADIRSLGAWYLSRWNQLARRPVHCL